MSDIGPSLLSELNRYRAQLKSAEQSLTTLDTENTELHAANRDLNDEVHGLRQALADMARQLDDARDLAARSGVFQTNGGPLYAIAADELDDPLTMPLVDPDGRLFK